MGFVIKEIPATTIVYYDEPNLWARDSAMYFQDHGFTTISYQDSISVENPIPLPEAVPYLIIGTVLTPTLIDRVPPTCPQLYGLDGSIFWPLTGTTAVKASQMQFQCIEYSPLVTTPLVQNVSTAINKPLSYVFPSTLDAIYYSRYYLNGFSNNTIQETTSGLSGSLTFINNDRAYGNLSWYRFNNTDTTPSWNFLDKIIIDPTGTCMINP